MGTSLYTLLGKELPSSNRAPYMLGQEAQTREEAVHQSTAISNLFRETKFVEVSNQLLPCTLMEHVAAGPNPRGRAFLYFRRTRDGGGVKGSMWRWIPGMGSALGSWNRMQGGPVWRQQGVRPNWDSKARNKSQCLSTFWAEGYVFVPSYLLYIKTTKKEYYKELHVYKFKN